MLFLHENQLLVMFYFTFHDCYFNFAIFYMLKLAVSCFPFNISRLLFSILVVFHSTFQQCYFLHKNLAVRCVSFYISTLLFQLCYFLYV